MTNSHLITTEFMKKLIYVFIFCCFSFLSVNGQEQLSDNTKVYLTGQKHGIWVYQKGQKPRILPETRGLGFRDLVMVDGVIYLTTHGPDGIWEYKPGSGQAPRQLPGTAGLGFRSVAAAGIGLYCTTQGPDGIWQYIIGRSQAPKQIAQTAGLGFQDVTVSGQELFLTTQGADGIYICEVDRAFNDMEARPVVGTAGFDFKSITNYGQTLFMTTKAPNGLYTTSFGYRAKLTEPVAQLPLTAAYGFRGIVGLNDKTYLVTTQSKDGIFIYTVGENQYPKQLPGTAGLRFRNMVIAQ